VIVGLIGAGNMAGALAEGWSLAEAGPDSLIISDLDPDRARALADRVGAKKAESNRVVAESADVVVLAMKPDGLAPVAEDVRVTVAERALPVVSILGATSTGAVEAAFGPGTPVLRFMPNVAAEVRAGTFCYAAGTALDARTQRSLLDLFGLLGELVPIPERLMDAATAISGCGPAFLALVVEALVDAGVREGLQAQEATELALTTMAGTAELLRKWEGDTVTIKRKVTSPGGSTAAGLAALEEHGVRAAFAAAVGAVVRRARETQSMAAQPHAGDGSTG
jgi:pyrroline-5-carboxylate reductase